MSDCVIALSSITYAMKGERVLGAEGIPVRQVRLEPRATRRGCAFGLAVPCSRRRIATELLAAAGIPFSQVLH
jgi:hypothetical protein